MDNSYYELLGVERSAPAAAIKRGFRQRALAVHPDRSTASDANEAFTWLRHVHDVLLDPEKRALYDEHGPNAVESSDESDPTNAAFWANSTSKVTPEDIAAYEKKYPGSEDETEDLCEFYTRFHGNVAAVLMYIPFAEESDLVRFVEIWDSQIASGRLEQTNDYTTAKKKLSSKIKAIEKKQAKETRQARKANAAGRSENLAERCRTRNGGSSKKGEDLADLAAMIRSRGAERQKDFDEWADSLAKTKKRKRQ